MSEQTTQLTREALDWWQAHARMLARAADNEKADAKFWRERAEKAESAQATLQEENARLKAANDDPEQGVVMHLLQELKPDCGCAVCQVLQEYCEETFGGDERPPSKAESDLTSLRSLLAQIVEYAQHKRECDLNREVPWCEPTWVGGALAGVHALTAEQRKTIADARQCTCGLADRLQELQR